MSHEDSFKRENSFKQRTEEVLTTIDSDIKKTYKMISKKEMEIMKQKQLHYKKNPTLIYPKFKTDKILYLTFNKINHCISTAMERGGAEVHEGEMKVFNLCKM